MFRSINSFLPNTSGNTGPLFALAIVPLLLGAGLAVDYARYSNAQADLGVALDGAAIAAAQAENKSDAERIVIGEAYFNQQFTYNDINEVKLDIIVEKTSVTATANVQMPTALMKLAGIDTMDVVGMSEVARPMAGKAEVVLVLDYSGSMKDNNKYKRMATAASNMVKDLAKISKDNDLKIGLVPFSAMVHTSMSALYVTQPSASPVWTGCTQDRASPYNLTVTTPIIGDDNTKWGFIDASGENSGSRDCAAYAKKQLNIVPLTKDEDLILARLNNMTPLGNTNISLGAEFGWNLLDPDAPYQEGVAYGTKDTKKYLVLLTDGVQTSSGFGPGASRNITHAQKNLVSLCDGMRAKDIAVFAIAYDITDKSVTTLLKKCAPGRYFEPSVDASDIAEVFAAITSEISNEYVRLTK